MLKITNKKLSIALLFVFGMLLIPVVWGIVRSGKSETTTNTQSPRRTIVPLPSYIPEPEVVSDSAPSEEEISIIWEVDGEGLPANSNFYTTPSIGVEVPEANTIARRFGFTSSSKPLNTLEPILSWSEGGKNLQIHLDSGFVLYTSSITRGKGDIDSPLQKEVSTKEEAGTIADTFLKSLNILSEGSSIQQKEILLVDQEGEIDLTINPTTDFLYQITYSYLLDGNPLLLQRGNDEAMVVLVDRLGTVRQIQYWTLSPTLSNKKVSLIPFDTIKMGVTNNTYPYSFLSIDDVLNPPKLTLIRISSISFGYLYDFISPQFFPVYVLYGEGVSESSIVPLTFTIPALESN